MKLFDSVATIFSRKGKSAVTAGGSAASSSSVPRTMRTGTPRVGSAGVRSGGGVATDASSDVEVKPISVATPTAPSPRNKQEMIEELQRNYHEVVELIRKMDSHLDRADARAERFMLVAEKLDRVLPAIERMPEEYRETAERLNGQLVQVIEQNGATSERISATVNEISTKLERTVEGHEQVIGTMSEFRTTMGEMAGASGRAAVAVEALNKHNAMRDGQIERLVRTNQRLTWMAVGVCVVVAVTAIIIAAVAMMKVAG